MYRPAATGYAFRDRMWRVAGVSYSTPMSEGVRVNRIDYADFSAFHGIDQDYDGTVGLSEVLRLIQFYQLEGYHCDESSEDGYAPGADATAQDCFPHSSDYNPQDWRIDLNELLRAIQFYNTGGYTYCPESATEDGFCPGRT